MWESYGLATGTPSLTSLSFWALLNVTWNDTVLKINKRKYDVVPIFLIEHWGAVVTCFLCFFFSQLFHLVKEKEKLLWEEFVS